MTTRIVLASANKDKAREIRGVLSPLLGDVELIDRPADVPDVEETGDTLEENALLKARALCEATGLPAIADDTGLEVAALGGAPGVHTSRFAGEGASYDENVAKLLSELRGVSDRRATFRAVAAAVFPDGLELVAEGRMEGFITEERRGTNGFGYDPVFLPDHGDGRTFAEMSSDEKHAHSHRGRSLRALAALLADL